MAASKLRTDPTRMATVHRMFTTQFVRRFAAIRKGVLDYLKSDTLRSRWHYLTQSEKIQLLDKHIRDTVNSVMLSGGKWWESLIARAYLTGAERGYDDVYRPALRDKDKGILGKKDFINRIIHNRAAPPRDEWGRFMSGKAHELSERLAKGWNRQADILSQTIARTVVKGIANNSSPEKIAEDIQEISAGIPAHRAAAIARTEVTRAQAEGQLDSYEALGVKTVMGIPEVEIVTAGDERVCPECEALVGRTMPIEEARSIIPVHTNCRCAWSAVIDLPVQE